MHDTSLFATFADEVRNRLGFLAEHGWREHAARWPLVEYRTPSTRLVIRLRPAADDEHFFAEGLFESADAPDSVHFLPFSELYRRGHPDATSSDVDALMGRRFFPANDPEQIARSLERITTLLRTEGRELVEDRPGLVEEVRRVRSERAQERRLDERRPAADAAFKAEDWPAVVRELEPFEDLLQRSDRMKLDYARRHL